MTASLTPADQKRLGVLLNKISRMIKLAGPAAIAHP